MYMELVSLVAIAFQCTGGDDLVGLMTVDTSEGLVNQELLRLTDSELRKVRERKERLRDARSKS